jgi:hypothetical protein
MRIPNFVLVVIILSVAFANATSVQAASTAPLNKIYAVIGSFATQKHSVNDAETSIIYTGNTVQAFVCNETGCTQIVQLYEITYNIYKCTSTVTEGNDGIPTKQIACRYQAQIGYIQ